MEEPRHAVSVYLFAFGYFACYVPYSALTKALSSGLLGPSRLSGLELLPLSALASAAAMMATLTLLGWWSSASQWRLGALSLPHPTRWTLLSGLATAAILVTTTLAYTFEGVSIPLVMLLMRGGVLLLAPLIDLLSKRKVRWFSYVALALSALSLGVTFTSGGASALPLACIADIALYLLGYFVRLRFMSHLAKGDDPNAQRRYFVEEQLVAAPAAVVLLAALALFDTHAPSLALRRGFTEVWSSPALPWVLLIGLCSQGTGVFGALVLLDARENTFCVPLNRASSVLAGVLAGVLLSFLGQHLPNRAELVGAGLVVVSIGVLWLGPRLATGR